MTEIIQRFINAADEFHKRGACHVKTLLAFDSKTGKLRAWSWRAIDGWATRNIRERTLTVTDARPGRLDPRLLDALPALKCTPIIRGEIGYWGA